MVVVEPADTLGASLIGTAFDYLFRFELERTHKGKVHRQPWVSELAFNSIRAQYATTPKGRKKKNPGEFFLRCESIFSMAQQSYSTYVSLADPTLDDTVNIARASIELARFDLAYRVGNTHLIGQKRRKTDVQDLVNLVKAITFLPANDTVEIYLNPSFGAGSDLLHGADADLIVGTTLLDIKTSVKSHVSSTYLDQLLGYFLLCRLRRALDETFPVIAECGIYFSRQSHTVVFPTNVWTDRSDFRDFELWFFAFAFQRYIQTEDKIAAWLGV
jgi:hypothetical protein